MTRIATGLGALVLLAGASAAVDAQTRATGRERMEGERKEPPPAAGAQKAVAHLQALGGSGVTGTVWFVQEGGKVVVKAELQGLTPGKHGFHIHEFGDCSAADGSSAGGHFNPLQAPHAGHDADARHVGDMGNIEAGADGKAKLELRDGKMTFHGPASILGRGVIVHEKADDLTSQPSGDAGGRLACGVVGVTK